MTMTMTMMIIARIKMRTKTKRRVIMKRMCLLSVTGQVAKHNTHTIGRLSRFLRVSRMASFPEFRKAWRTFRYATTDFVLATASSVRPSLNSATTSDSYRITLEMDRHTDDKLQDIFLCHFASSLISRLKER